MIECSVCHSKLVSPSAKAVSRAYDRHRSKVSSKQRVLNFLLVGGDCVLVGLQPVLVYMSKVDGRFKFSPISVNFLTEVTKVLFAILMLIIQGNERKRGFLRHMLKDSKKTKITLLSWNWLLQPSNSILDHPTSTRHRQTTVLSIAHCFSSSSEQLSATLYPYMQFHGLGQLPIPRTSPPWFRISRPTRPLVQQQMQEDMYFCNRNILHSLSHESTREIALIIP
ncbi:CMP-sialic acid transporter 4 [Sesamum angolense]|uniref:CMP-sialic acid transporter 4 n=1 Tax=Sesamum angolense TaxID=2727404 RepID=A0AAE2C036_9LAMI|nr:CMP-sialic acid transporter 4 [Sesamum angolense]